MYEVIFLWVLALLYIIFAVFQDFKTREIANWITFSLAIFALVFRFFYSLFGNDFSFFFQGLIGFGIFFALGNLFYYSRVFAGGDAKLMIALGSILPSFPDIFSNIMVFLNFFLIFLFSGFLYISTASTILCVRNFKKFRKEFSKQLKRKRKLMLGIISASIIFLALGFLNFISAVLGILIFTGSYLFLYAKSIDEVCMIKKVNSKELREGDWLYSDLKAGKNIIKATWDGLTKRDIKEIAKRYKEIKIRQGIPFSPVFLISMILLIASGVFGINLWDSFGQP